MVCVAATMSPHLSKLISFGATRNSAVLPYRVRYLDVRKCVTNLFPLAVDYSMSEKASRNYLAINRFQRETLLYTPAGTKCAFQK